MPNPLHLHSNYYEWFNICLIHSVVWSKDPVKKASDKASSLLPWRQGFGEEIRFVVMRIDIAGPPFISGNTFTYHMICNALRFLLQSWIRDGGVGQHRLVISIYICRTPAWDSHHSEFINQPSDIFTALLHRSEFRSKTAAFNASLFLWEPIY